MNYLICPMERLAHIRSYLYMLKTLQHGSRVNRYLMEDISREYNKALLSGYASNNDCYPTRCYMQQNGSLELFNKACNFDSGDLTLEERLTLGLEVDYDEYIRTIRQGI